MSTPSRTAGLLPPIVHKRDTLPRSVTRTVPPKRRNVTVPLHGRPIRAHTAPRRREAVITVARIVLLQEATVVVLPGVAVA